MVDLLIPMSQEKEDRFEVMMLTMALVTAVHVPLVVLVQRTIFFLQW